MFCDEIYITMNKILGKYDNFLLRVDINFDDFKLTSDSSRH